VGEDVVPEHETFRAPIGESAADGGRAYSQSTGDDFGGPSRVKSQPPVNHPVPFAEDREVESTGLPAPGHGSRLLGFLSRHDSGLWRLGHERPIR
jgi:hypothetical protein